MELRDFARRVIESPRLDDKLAAPPRTTDANPAGDPPPSAPAREASLAIVTDPRRKRKVPSIEGMPDPAQRRRILHGLANHELQAVELFAWALLAFPAAPRAFRRGLLGILKEEQRHCRLYLARLAALGGRFGEEPLSGYFWSKARDWTTPSRFVAAMCLTFESANLDHALDLADAARAARDPATARVLERVFADEVRHVRFGWRWLARFKDEHESTTAAWRRSLAFPLRPELARGPNFRADSRVLAGCDDEYVATLAGAARPRSLYRVEHGTSR